MNFMAVLFAVIKSFVWVLLGVFYGASAFFLLFSSRYLYGQSYDFKKYFTYEFIMYLCVALMASAASDYADYPRGWKRIIPLGFCTLLLMWVYNIFNPAIPQHPQENIVENMAIGYGVMAIVFCMVFKGRLFYEECKSVKPIKF